MQIVIDIPEIVVKHCDPVVFLQKHDIFLLKNAVYNGTLLPEHYGDLIDRNELLKQYGLENATKYGNKDEEQQKHSYSTMMMYEIADMIEDAETIIPATEEVEQFDAGCKNCAGTDNCEFYQAGHRFLYICNRFTPKQTTTRGASCKDCKYQKFREVYSCVETPCDSCYEASCFETKEGDRK